MLGCVILLSRYKLSYQSVLQKLCSLFKVTYPRAFVEWNFKTAHTCVSHRIKEVHCQCCESNAVTWCSQGGYFSHSICFNDSANDFHPVLQRDQGYEGITWVFQQYFIVFKDKKLLVTVGIYKSIWETSLRDGKGPHVKMCQWWQKYWDSLLHFSILISDFFLKRDFSSRSLVRVTIRPQCCSSIVKN